MDYKYGLHKWDGKKDICVFCPALKPSNTIHSIVKIRQDEILPSHHNTRISNSKREVGECGFAGKDPGVVILPIGTDDLLVVPVGNRLWHHGNVSSRVRHDLNICAVEPIGAYGKATPVESPESAAAAGNDCDRRVGNASCVLFLIDDSEIDRPDSVAYKRYGEYGRCLYQWSGTNSAARETHLPAVAIYKMPMFAVREASPNR